MISRLTTTILAGIVTGIWAVNIMADIFSDYEASDQVNGIFMAIVGGLIAASRADRNKGGGGKDE